MCDKFLSLERVPRSVSAQSSSFSTEQHTYSINAAYHAILHEDGGQRIFASFGLEVGKRYVSPFRADATKKNVSISHDNKGTVFFKDFASGEAGSFTALLQNFGYHSFEAQIRYAAGLYGFALHDTASSPTSFPVRPQQPRNYSAPPTKKVVKTAFYRVPALHAGDFTLGGVQTLLNATIVEHLRANGNTLVICFDTDFVGISSAQKLAATLTTQHSPIPFVR